MTGQLAWMEPIESFFRGKSVSTFRVFKYFLVSHRADYWDFSTLCGKKQRVELLSQKTRCPPCPDTAPRLPTFFGGVCLPRNEPKKPLTRGDTFFCSLFWASAINLRLIGGGERPHLPPLPKSLQHAAIPAKERHCSTYFGRARGQQWVNGRQVPFTATGVQNTVDDLWPFWSR